MIDDFRNEVSGMAEFQGLDLYEDSAKLMGNIGDVHDPGQLD